MRSLDRRDFSVRGACRHVVLGAALVTAAHAGQQSPAAATASAGGLAPPRAAAGEAKLGGTMVSRGYRIPIVDISAEKARQVVVDREPGQYLGHPTTVLLEDGKTLLAVYPKGHGKGAIVYKRSRDGGRTWSGRLPTPSSWGTSLEVPTLYRAVDAAGKRRLLL
ncbi:MAG TPA: hypothetical protein VGN26_23830, partial [Armatimonadota bacterium]